METTILPCLPDELVTQILLNLPVKSLIRFKSVCKSWFSLISHDAHFANSHFEITATKHTRRLVFISNFKTANPNFMKPLSIDFEASLDINTASQLPNPNPNFIRPHPDHLIKNTCSCRGFVLLRYHKNIYLWNPSTGANKRIPFSPFRSDLDDADYFFGFGYDELRDDYLLVSICCAFVPSLSLSDVFSHLEFFSLRDNTWKELEDTDFPYTLSCEQHKVGSFVNGSIHWLGFRHTSFINAIIAFDVMERKHVEMPFPDGFEFESDYCDLMVYRESLSIWAMDFVNGRAEIWVMNEYKVHSSWTKTLVLPTYGKTSYYFFPICSTKSDEIIATNGETGLLRYNDRGQLIEHDLFWDGPFPMGSQVVVYTESLLSLPVDNVQA